MPTKNHIILPKWLDDYIFNTLSATFEKKCKDLVVLNWDATDIQCYLGTYFPRSFAESYGIFSQYFQKNRNDYDSQTELTIFDFGCGTGGELIGLIAALNENLENLQEVKIYALDGNYHSLRYLELILSESKKYLHFDIFHQVIPVVIEDFYDLSLVENECLKLRTYDIAISFKAICEFVTKQELEEKNPYAYLINTLLPYLSDNGIICLADVTSYSDVAHNWLPSIIDNGINSTPMDVICKNENYNETFYITHSHKQNDISKIAWRILKTKRS